MALSSLSSLESGMPLALNFTVLTSKTNTRTATKKATSPSGERRQET